jgi:ABC-type multidrug transport system ATPase subunit/ABC-type multidrug transport system permease subunit
MACRTSMCCWDNPTRGLDASTSLEFATTLRNNCTLTHTTAVVAAYQAGENMTLLFDKVTILYLGRQIFFGTLLDAKAHFEGIGFVCRDRQTTADFLTAITDPQGRRVRPGWEAKAPRTPQEFVQFWKDSSYYTALQEDIKQYNAQYSNPETQLQAFKKLQGSQKNKSARMQSSYLASVPSQFATMIKRSTQRVLGDKAYIVAGSFSSIYMALILGSIFYNTPSNTSGFFSKGGVLFFSVLFNALQSMAEVGTQYAQRPIVEKQKGLRMYHPFVDSLATVVAEYPLKFTNVLIFDVVIYFMVGLKQEAGAFFIFLLVTYLTTILTSAMFRAIAACTKKSETASSIVGIMILVLSIYTGYVIPPPSMHPWFSWLRYINPVQYGFEALMVNEFHGKHGACTSLVPSGPGYEGVSIVNQVCSVVGSVTGQATVSGDAYVGDSFQYYHEHLWRNIGILVGFFVFFLILTAIAVELNPPEPSKGEFLVFRKGHEPEHVKKALDSGKAVDDVEVGSNEPVLTAVKTAVSEFQGLVQCEDLFTWEHLNYDITLGDGSTRRLLNDVSGYVRPGTLTALMGESGAGKTTLLNVLAQRVDTGVVTGDRLVSSYPTGNSFQRQTGYVQQQDVHVAESTVREALRFSALLRQPASVPVKEKYDYVETVINILEMEEYAEAVIGTPGHGLNVEQRKRTTIGIELVARPALLLFLDEPTSGLDSRKFQSMSVT